MPARGIRSRSVGDGATARRLSAVTLEGTSSPKRSASDADLSRSLISVPERRQSMRLELSDTSSTTTDKTSSVTSDAPFEQNIAAIVDLPWPDAPTKAKADPPTSTALPWSTHRPLMASRNAVMVPAITIGKTLFNPSRERMAHHSFEIARDFEVSHPCYATHVAICHSTERVPGRSVHDQFGDYRLRGSNGRRSFRIA